MDDIRAGIEANVRAKHAAKMQRELVASEQEILWTYDERIDAVVNEAAHAAALDALENASDGVARYRECDIADAADAIRARYEALIQQEVERRLAARGTRRRARAV